MDHAQNRLRLVTDTTPTGAATAVADSLPAGGPSPTASSPTASSPTASSSTGASPVASPAPTRRQPGALLAKWGAVAMRLLRPGITAVRDYWIVGVAVLGVLAIIGGALWLLWTTIKALLAALTAAGDGFGQFAHWITAGPISRSISDPVTAYLSAHSQGLPASGHQLWMAWLVVAAVLYFGAVLASPYARIGWAAVGLLTTWAAYAGAPNGAGAGAAAATFLVWLLFSTVAYTRTPRPAQPSGRGEQASRGTPRNDETADLDEEN